MGYIYRLVIFIFFDQILQKFIDARKKLMLSKHVRIFWYGFISREDKKQQNDGLEFLPLFLTSKQDRNCMNQDYDTA